jgi:hypothetical protein
VEGGKDQKTEEIIQEKEDKQEDIEKRPTYRLNRHKHKLIYSHCMSSIYDNHFNHNPLNTQHDRANNHPKNYKYKIYRDKDINTFMKTQFEMHLRGKTNQTVQRDPFKTKPKYKPNPDKRKTETLTHTFTESD